MEGPDDLQAREVADLLGHLADRRLPGVLADVRLAARHSPAAVRALLEQETVFSVLILGAEQDPGETIRIFPSSLASFILSDETLADMRLRRGAVNARRGGDAAALNVQRACDPA